MKFIYLTICFLLLDFLSYSQTHQVYGGAGYNFPAPTSIIGKSIQVDSYNQTLGNFAKGVTFHVGYSYRVIDNLSLDIKLNYLYGVSDYEYSTSNSQFSITGEDHIDRPIKYSNSNISISPTLVVNTRIGEFVPYLKFGCSLNFIQIDDTWVNKLSGSQTDPFRNTGVVHNFIYRSNFTFGWLAGIGINLPLGVHQLFLEAELNSITFYPDEVTYKDNELDVKDEIDPYKDSSGYDVLHDFPFSSIGVVAGVRINIDQF